MQLAVPTIVDPGQAAWQLTEFTWLSSSGSGANDTGRGFISVFDAAAFDPAGMSAADVNTATTGLVGRSATYNTVTGAYVFTGLVLESGKTYYFLNSNAMSTTLTNPAPYQYGFSTSASVEGVTRWVVSDGEWTSQTGAPNYAVTLEVIPVPEPGVLGLALVAGAGLTFRRRRRVA